MTEEKYVTIPFDVWESKYKGLEKESNRLLVELKELEERRRIDIRLISRQLPMLNTGTRIGYIDLSTDIGSFMLKIEDRERLRHAIESEFKKVDTFGVILTPKQADDLLTKNIKTTNEYQRVTSELLKRLNKIPKFIKWLFKIKIENL